MGFAGGWDDCAVLEEVVDVVVKEGGGLLLLDGW